MIRIIVKFEIMDLFVIIYTEYIVYMYYNIDTGGSLELKLYDLSARFIVELQFATKRGIVGLSDKQKKQPRMYCM